VTDRKADHPTPAAYQAAAWLLMCEPAAIQAVAEVETRREGAFLDSGEPTILFERHVFHELTRGRFAGARVPGAPAAWSLISNPIPGGYGPTSAQHRRLQAAVALDRDAALRSASWGLYQQLGRDQQYSPSLQRFITAMYRGVDDHLRAFVMFIRASERLVDALRGLDWPTFARWYNGPGHARHDYAGRMAAAYERAAEELRL
jgi:hypothetical protein